MFTMLLGYVVFLLACFVVSDLCRGGCRQNYYLTRRPLPIFSLPTILSLTHKAGFGAG